MNIMKKDLGLLGNPGSKLDAERVLSQARTNRMLIISLADPSPTYDQTQCMWIYLY